MIGLYNIKSDLRKRLEQVFDTCGLDQLEVDSGFPQLSGLFVDWKNKDVNEIEFAHQAVIIENYVKTGIPVVIFDRHLKLSFKEYSWLKKFNTTFLEPAIKGRVGFDYFPFWTEPLQKGWFPYLDREEPREIELVYKGQLDDRIHSFEKYYSEYARLYPNKKVAFQTNPERLGQKILEWKESNLSQVNEIDFNKTGFIILIGSKKEYESGYLREDLFDIMKLGCVPILPIEHRFYGTVFKDLCIKSEKDLNFILSLYKINGVIIEEINDNFLTYFPECNIENSTDKIKSFFTI